MKQKIASFLKNKKVFISINIISLIFIIPIVIYLVDIELPKDSEFIKNNYNLLTTTLSIHIAGLFSGIGFLLSFYPMKEVKTRFEVGYYTSVLLSIGIALIGSLIIILLIFIVQLLKCENISIFKFLSIGTLVVFINFSYAICRIAYTSYIVLVER